MNHSALVLVPENRFAHAAAIRLLDPSNGAVPIVTVYGASGVGKSQMARQIARQALIERPNVRLLHLTAAEFCIELAKASQSGMLDEFQATYRKQDLLICEDLQTLQKRPESQAQLLVIIDEIVAGGGRVLLTCNQPPGELKGLCPKLINRCHGGVCGEIELPRPGTRAVLLQEFAEGRGLALKDRWVQRLAKRVDGTPRELMGAIIQLESLASAAQRPIDDGIVEEFLSRLHESAGATLADITRRVAIVFDVSVSDIRDGGRGQALVVPRQVAMYIAREGGKHRFKEIGRFFGGRSHSTVVHACQQIEERLQEDTLLWQQMQRICDGLQMPHLLTRRQPVEDPSPIGPQS
jgi:chromosomal replication initiator protein